MKIRSKIQEAWILTQANPGLKWFGFFPSFIGILVGIGWLIYQYVTLGPILFNSKIDYTIVFNYILTFLRENGTWTIPTIIVAVIVILSYLLLPVLFHGGLIALINRIESGKPYSFLKGISLGLFSYLRLFEYKAILSPFSVFTLISLSGLILRTYGWSGFSFMLPFLIIILIFAFILGFFFSYADFLIVIKKTSVSKAMTKSAGIVALNLPETALIMLLMILIGVRILINIVIILLAPLLAIFLAAYLSTFALGQVGIILVIIATFILLFFAAYISALVSVFTTAVWVLTFNAIYEESMQEMEEKDS